MKRSFDLNFGEYVLILKKEDVHFVNGYGIVTAQDNNGNLLIGVVDDKFKEVLPLTSAHFAPKLFVALNGNFIFVGYNSEIDEYQVFHIDINNNQYNLGANDFLILNDEIIQLYYDEYSVLYNTQIWDFITPFYHYIGPFIYSEKYGCKIARASFYVEDDNHKIINEVSTIINTNGEVLENYYDLRAGEELDCKDSTIVLDLIRKKSNKG